MCVVAGTYPPYNQGKRYIGGIIGADGETRTLTMLPSGDFESPASTIPPHRPPAPPNVRANPRQSGFATIGWSRMYRNRRGTRFPIRAGTIAAAERLCHG